MSTTTPATMLHTRICDELGVTYPILCAGMGDVTMADLTAAVSNAGGMGVIGGTSLPPEQLRAEIRRVRALTDRPFGVDLLLPVGLPPDLSSVSVPEVPPFMQELEQAVRDLPDPPERRVLTEAFVRAQFAVLVEEAVPLVAAGLGTPPWLAEEAHAVGMRVLALVGSVDQARRVEQLGVDFIVAQGAEAGGHTGRVGTFVLVPAVVDAVRVPVLAAGGVGDGRGVAAALLLGAAGVWVGTRFLMSPEAMYPHGVKERLLRIGDDGTTVTRAYTGKTSRVVRNRYTRLWEGNEQALRPMPLQSLMVEPVVGKARHAEDVEIANWPAGQVSCLVDAIKPAGEITRELAADAARLLAGLPGVGLAAT